MVSLVEVIKKSKKNATRFQRNLKKNASIYLVAGDKDLIDTVKLMHDVGEKAATVYADVVAMINRYGIATAVNRAADIMSELYFSDKLTKKQKSKLYKWSNDLHTHAAWGSVAKDPGCMRFEDLTINEKWGMVKFLLASCVRQDYDDLNTSDQFVVVIAAEILKEIMSKK